MWNRMLVCLIALALIASPSANAQTYTFTVLKQFAGQPDGSSPFGGVVVDAQGNLYVTTYYGGASNQGTAFKLDSTAKPVWAHSFGPGYGANPSATLTLDATTGFTYGTTQRGGACCGTFFRLDSAGNESYLFSFPTGEGAGAVPLGSVLGESKSGLFWSTTSQRGAHSAGTVFSVNVNFPGSETYYSFGSTPGDG
jgi:uncharacterized repeat protein (TIGR03803 family)